MSDALSIAAVTSTLRTMLFTGVSPVVSLNDVTTMPLDRAREGKTGNQLNIFLYRTAINGDLRSLPPQGLQPREDGYPSLPLALFYLVTAYGTDDDDAVGHQLLGAAMRVLHDRPLLSSTDLFNALNTSDLYRQVERVRITSQPLSVDELSRLWTTFQTQYRISAAYQASVVFIDSLRPARTPAPVLTRGPDDVGPQAQPSLVAPYPALDRATPNSQLPFAVAGDELVLTGRLLGGTEHHVVFEHAALDAPVDVPPAQLTSTTPEELRLTLPGTVPAGIVSIGVTLVDPQGTRRETNRVSMTIAPSITTPLPITVQRDPAGTVSVDLDVDPPVFARQHPRMLAGDQVAEPAAFADPSGTLSFALPLAPAEYLLRVRVDGIDSPFIDRSQTPPIYDPDQKLVVEP